MDAERYNTRSGAQRRPAISTNHNTTATSSYSPPPQPPARARPTPKSARRAMQPPQSARKQYQPDTGGGIGNLTYEQREELQQIFATLDSAGRGYIPASKLANVVDALGLPEPTDDVLESWMAQVDPRNTGRIDYPRLEEFVSLRYDEADQRREMLNAFKLFKPDARDVDRDGITFEDLQRISTHLGEHIPDDELREMINIADVDGAGQVNFADFMRVMRKTGIF
ncbi:hypothetical protein GGI12_000881 [Dipsacomyces acuminosporus]|nr:hypothetical protein GGI12_000881 [Dipsacomyces acuminosporus]